MHYVGTYKLHPEIKGMYEICLFLNMGTYKMHYVGTYKLHPEIKSMYEICLF